MGLTWQLQKVNDWTSGTCPNFVMSHVGVDTIGKE